MGFNTIDDAGVFRLNDDFALVQTVDFFTPIVDDPYTYGAIAATNSLSDVYAMGGVPVTALNIVCFPQKTVSPDLLTAILRGGYDKATQAGCVIVGGHSVEDNEMKYGLSVTGKINPNKILTNAKARPGDALILTKALGTGIVTTAFKLDTISEELYKIVTESMLTLNDVASRVAVEFDARACTDITGFGLLGHAWGMARASEVGLIFYASQISIFPGVLELAAKGLLTKGDVTTREYLGDNVRIDKNVDRDFVKILYDPQTSGGLLISVDAEAAEQCLAKLNQEGVPFAHIVGRVTKENAGMIAVVSGRS